MSAPSQSVESSFWSCTWLRCEGAGSARFWQLWHLPAPHLIFILPSLHFIWHRLFGRSWHQHFKKITKRFYTALIEMLKCLSVHPSLWIFSRWCLIPFFSFLFLPSVPLPSPCIPYLPSHFIIVNHVVAHTFLQICLLLILCIHFGKSAILFVIAICDFCLWE